MSIAKYWRDQVAQLKEFKVIAQSEDPEIAKVSEKITQLIDDQFIQTATEKGIARREKLLSITPYRNDTLNDRRFRVMSLWNNFLPYNYFGLIQRLNTLCGQDGYDINLNHNEYSLEIKVELTTKRMIQAVDTMVRNICPCNLLITIRLKYNKHFIFTGIKHSQLAAHTHRALREEVL